MVVLRATQKILRTLPRSANDSDTSDTALGDWYVNRIIVDRQPLLLLVSSKSLLAILVPARDVRTLPDRFPGMVADRLRQLGVDLSLIGSEMDVMHAVRVGPTQDRSVLGTMVNFAKAVPYYLPVNGWSETTLRSVEDRLAETPCQASGRFEDVIFPERTALRLLEERWVSRAVTH
jgi:hypothetical protein